MQKAYITIGISASGKSTWAKANAKALNAIITNRDDLRFSLSGAKNWDEYKFNKHIENHITQIQRSTIEQAWKEKKSVIVADTNLNPQFRKQLMDFCSRIGFCVEIKEFPISLEEAWKRDALRENGVGHDVIYKQYQQWLEYKQRKVAPINNPENKPKAIIVDADGTLAHMNGRGPFDWHRVGEDRVDFIVRDIVNGLYNKGYKILVTSGRDGVCYNDTKEWLDCNEISYTNLFMRTQGDTRKDSVVKEEIYWQNIASQYFVVAAIDDRPQVVRLWQELGIKVINVGNPYIEF